MRYLVVMLLMTFISCKNETKVKTEIVEEDVSVSKSKSETTLGDGTNQSVYDMWSSYIKSNPEFANQEMPTSDFFHNNKADANRLAHLTLGGDKRASSGLYALYQHYGVELPKDGNLQIITDFNGKAIAIIETKSVDTIPFGKITAEYAAMDMGTHIDPLKVWKKAHWDFFANVLKEIGRQPTEDMLVVCETFEKIWPE